MSIAVTADYHTFHIVSQDTLRNPHVQKCVGHANKQIFLLCIRKKLNVALSAVMTDYRKTSGLENCSINALYVYEPPVHLVCLACLG